PRRARRARGLLPRAQLRGGSRRPRRRARQRGVRRALRLAGRPRLVPRRPVPPREVLARRPATARQLGRPRQQRWRVILYPAIDILDGHAVRLVQGDFDQRTEYAADPLDAAREWAAAGAQRL